MLRLLLAACWLILGGVMLAWQWSGAPGSSLGGRGVSLGWFGIVMAFYNLLRWWLSRPGGSANHR
jgi:hypothetical protein